MARNSFVNLEFYKNPELNLISREKANKIVERKTKQRQKKHLCSGTRIRILKRTLALSQSYLKYVRDIPSFTYRRIKIYRQFQDSKAQVFLLLRRDMEKCRYRNSEFFFTSTYYLSWLYLQSFTRVICKIRYMFPGDLMAWYYYYLKKKKDILAIIFMVQVQVHIRNFINVD